MERWTMENGKIENESLKKTQIELPSISTEEDHVTFLLPCKIDNLYRGNNWNPELHEKSGEFTLSDLFG